MWNNCSKNRRNYFLFQIKTFKIFLNLKLIYPRLFKRLMNINKFQATKPIILGKRPSVWSINDHHLKVFFKCFQKIQRAIPVLDLQAILPLIAQHQLHSQRIWKLKVEQLKLYMQIKHSGYMWLTNSPSTAHESQSNASLNNSPVKTPRKNPYNTFESPLISNFDTNNENSYSCFPPSFVFTKIRPTFQSKTKSVLRDPSQLNNSQCNIDNSVLFSSPPISKFVLAPISSLVNNNEISLSASSAQMPHICQVPMNATNSLSYFTNSGSLLTGQEDVLFDEVIRDDNEISMADDLLF